MGEAKGGRRCEPIERKAIRAEFCDGIAVLARLACCAGKRCAFPQLRTLPGSNPGVWVAKKPATGRVTGFSNSMVPPAGFEPAISTLKGWRPWPLDDGDSAVEYTRYLVCEKPIFHVNSYC